MTRKQRNVAAHRHRGPAISGALQAFVQTFNEGLRLYQIGQLGAAADLFRRAVAFNPKHALTHSNLGSTLNAQGKFDEALVHFQRAIALDPSFAMAHNNLGVTLRNLYRYDKAVAALRQALSLRPDYPEAFNNLAATLMDIERFDEAEANYKKALSLNPDYAEALSNYGTALQEVGRTDEAIAYFRRAIALVPNLAMAHKNLGLTLLRKGAFADGWDEYEWRWLADKFPPRSYPKPLWQGEPLAGKTLLLYAEQGIGDAMQFARFVPLIAATGARVVLEVHPQLTALCQTLNGVADVIPLFGTTPSFDYYLALMSVPRVLGITPQTIPSPTPYLTAEPTRTQLWRDKLGSHGFKIGINWQGNIETPKRAARSASLACFAPLAGIEGVRLISLQKPQTDAPIDAMIASLGIETLGPDFDAGLGAFLDTAAVMTGLDLVITIDTSVAHLAGAMGRPTWIALKRTPDWRWQMEGCETAWYPAARLYRQHEADKWDDVFAAMARDLHALTAKGG